MPLAPEWLRMRRRCKRLGSLSLSLPLSQYCSVCFSFYLSVLRSLSLQCGGKIQTQIARDARATSRRIGHRRRPRLFMKKRGRNIGRRRHRAQGPIENYGQAPGRRRTMFDRAPAHPATCARPLFLCRHGLRPAVRPLFLRPLRRRRQRAMFGLHCVAQEAFQDDDRSDSPIGIKFGRTSGQIWSSSAKFGKGGRSRAQTGRVRPAFRQTWWSSGEICQTMLDIVFGQLWQDSARIRPTCGGFGRMWPGCGRIRPACGWRPNLGEHTHCALARGGEQHCKVAWRETRSRAGRSARSRGRRGRSSCQPASATAQSGTAGRREGRRGVRNAMAEQLR